MDPRIQNVLKAMRSNCGEPLTASGMAAQVGLSRCRFEHLFREQTGASFRGVLTELRLAKATALLADSRRRIKEVASLCGYASTASFGKAFRRRSGKTPSDYRRSAFGRIIAEQDNELELTA